jgi:hypothetical protein
VVALCLAASAAAAPKAKGTSPCAAKAGDVVTQNRRVVVLVRRRGRSLQTLACAASNGKVRLLGPPGSAKVGSVREQVQNVELAGRWLAYSWSVDYLDTVASGVVLQPDSLLAPKRFPAFWEGATGAYNNVTQLVLAPSGAVAWIAASSSPGEPDEQPWAAQVAVAQEGKASALANSRAIGLHSLRLRGRTLSWRNGSQPESARLP